jgi:hypothetical protein
MKPVKAFHVTFLVLLLVLGLILSSCNMPLNKVETPVPSTQIPATPLPEPEATSTPVPEIVHKDLPGGPIGKIYQTIRWTRILLLKSRLLAGMTSRMENMNGHLTSP